MNKPSEGENWAWDRYWQADRLASCLGEGDPADEAAIERVWSTFFAAFADGARLLDICTGNGAVAIVAAQSAKSSGKSFEIHGADLAAIEPTEYVRSQAAVLGEIQFHGKTAAENLPFGDAGFDGATSQFGLEYTDTARSVPEMARVLKPGARVLLLVHAAEGALVAPNVDQIRQSRFLLERSGIFHKAGVALETAWETEHAASPNRRSRAAATKARKDFQKAVDATSRRLKDCRRPQYHEAVLSRLAEIYGRRAAFPLPQLRGMMGLVQFEVKAHGERMASLERAAKTEAECGNLVALLEAAGFKRAAMTALRVGADQALVAWRIDAQRASAG